MDESTRITRFADVIVEPKTQHAWVLRANFSNGEMECECLRCGRIETMTSIERWNGANKGGAGSMVIKHAAAWNTITEKCPSPTPRYRPRASSAVR